MKGRWKLILLVVTVLVLLAILLSYQLEQVSENEKIPPIAEVQRNPFVAAERTLTALGREVAEIDGRPDDFRKAGVATIFWPGPRGAVSRYAIDAAEEFVAAGGHLIVGSEDWYDPVLERFAIEVVEHEDHYDDYDPDDFDDEEFDNESLDDESAGGEDGVGGVSSDGEPVDRAAIIALADRANSRAALGARVSAAADSSSKAGAANEGLATGDSPGVNPLSKSELPPLEQGIDEDDLHDCACESQRRWSADGWLGEPPLTFELPHNGWLASEQPLLARIGPPNQPQIVQIRVGQGWVTALTAPDIFGNGSLGDADHAEALVRLVALAGPQSRFLIIRAMPGGFGDWLLETAWRMLIFVALLIVLALWRAIPRFGPIAADPPPQRRRLLDHLLASGRLLWSRGEHALLARAASDSALASVYAEYPHARWLPEPAFNAFMQRRFSLDPSLLALLRNPDGVRHMQSLITLTRCAQRIHRSLAAPAADSAHSSLYNRREHS